MFFRTFFYFLIYFVSFHIGATPEKIPSQAKTPATNAIAKKKIIKYNIEIKTSYTNTITETDKNYIKKNIFEILMQTGRFNIILGHHYKKTRRDNLFSLVLQVNDARAVKGRRRDDLKAKLMLRDEVSNILINFKEEKRILRNKLQKTIRSMVLGIFYGKNFNPETQQIYDNKIIPLRKDKPKSAPRNKKKGPSDSDSEEPDVEENSEFPDEEQPKSPGKKSFKKKEPKKKTKKKVAIADFDSPNIDLTREEQSTPKKEVEIPTSWANQFRMYAGGVSEEIISDAIVEIGTATSRIVIGVDGHMGVSGRNHFYTYGAEVGMIPAHHEFGFGPKYDFYGGYNIAPFGHSFSIGPSVSLSNLNYAAVFEAGSRVRKFSGAGLWTGLKSEFFYEFGNFSLLLDIRYQKVMTGTITSSLGDSVAASGHKFIMSARITFWGHLGIGIRQERIEMTTLTDSNLLVHDNSLGTFLTYQ